MKLHAVFFTLAFICLTSCVFADVPRDLLVVTEDYAPLNYVENGTLQGISVDLVTEALQNLDPSIRNDSFQVKPWSEAFDLAENRNNTMLFSTDRTTDREKKFLWAGPLVNDRKVLFGTRGMNASNISRLRIVALEDDSGYKNALNAGALPELITQVNTPAEAIRMIEENTTDLWSYGEISGETNIRKYAANPSGIVTVQILGTVDNYIAFNRNTSPAFVQEVNTSLTELRKDRAKTGVTPYERILYKYLPVQCSPVTITSGNVTGLVNKTAKAIETDAKKTIASINAGKAPYKDPDNPELYAFVFHANGTLMANAVNQMAVGTNLSGTVDASGKPFRDEMISGALVNGSGWVSYVYSSTNTSGLFTKSSYYRLVNGSDGEEYVVGSGRFVSCDESE